MKAEAQEDPDFPDCLDRLAHAEFCLQLYHEAWNGCEGDWHKAMRIASQDTTRYFDKYEGKPRP